MNNFKKIVSVYNIVKQIKPNEIYKSFRPISLSAVRTSEKVSFTIEMDGKSIPVSTLPGQTLRDVIAKHQREIGEDYGICDGTMACSTCHVMFSQKDFDRLPEEPSSEEIDLLDVTPNFTDTSRLACAIVLSPELEGITVKVPNVRYDQRSAPNSQSNC